MNTALSTASKIFNVFAILLLLWIAISFFCVDAHNLPMIEGCGNVANWKAFKILVNLIYV